MVTSDTSEHSKIIHNTMYLIERCKTQTTYHPKYGMALDVIICFTMRFFYSETSIKIGHVNETSILLKFLFDHLTKDTSSC